jgi:hypothetical protein
MPDARAVKLTRLKARRNIFAAETNDTSFFPQTQKVRVKMLFCAFLSLMIFQIVSCDLQNSFSVTSSSSPLPIPAFPLQFTGNLKIIAHLISEDSDYPPKIREMKIYYDYVNKLARADIASGYEAAKEYYRNYREKVEYMVRTPPINDCHRAYLGTLSLPFLTTHLSIQVRRCLFQTSVRRHMSGHELFRRLCAMSSFTMTSTLGLRSSSQQLLESQ